MIKHFVLISAFCLSAIDLFCTDDTLRVNWLSEINVTANKFESKPSGSGTSVSSLSSEQIKTLPAMNISNTLKYLPGLFIASHDGTGLNPLVTIRGFHGGGESEYLTVLVDGVPINSLENGLVSWNMLPLNQISRIEILRGGASAIYGDAAMGGVINLVTHKTYKPYTQAMISYGSFNSLNSGLNFGNKVGKGFFDLYANYEHTDGFRDNSNYTTAGFGGRFRYPLSNNTSITINSVNQILKMQEPGPLLQEMIDKERNRSTFYFREDGRDQNKYLLGLDLRSKLSNITDLSVTLSYQHNDYDASRTFTQPSLILGSNFQPIGIYDTTLYGNTKNRIFTSNQLLIASRLFSASNSGRFRIVGGVDFDLGNFNTEVFDVFKGFETDYENLSKANSLDFDGMGRRFKICCLYQR
jgi:outer membrane receptor for Fe3+-dicitrate